MPHARGHTRTPACSNSAIAPRIKIATVAVARKLACLTWQLLTHQRDYIYERPALTFRKLRQLGLAAGAPKRSNPRGSRGPATPDTPAQWATEREAALHVEKCYRTAVANWKPHDHPRQSLDYIRRAFKIGRRGGEHAPRWGYARAAEAAKRPS